MAQFFFVNFHTFLGAKVASSSIIAVKVSLMSSSATWMQGYGRHPHTEDTRHIENDSAPSPNP